MMAMDSTSEFEPEDAAERRFWPSRHVRFTSGSLHPH